nr:TonB-dependent receptor [uncultured Carboxylicivirga sp.]
MKNSKNQPPKVLLLAILGLFFFASSGWAQQVKGKITDSKNGVLPGVTVMVKGSTDIGTITDMEGKYVLNVPDAQNAILQVTFIGMENQEIPVQGRAVIDIVMQDEFTQLDEVVAIGYGTVKKRDITGAVASVGGDDLKQIPVASAAEAMTGRMAGVQVTSTEGSPDAELTIRVRGGGSISQDNSPLIIVDGFPVNSLNDISPADIENIDVLKDASSTAIYGSRGANGVIIVTTKSGEAGKLQVNYNAFTGVKKLAKQLDVLDAYDYASWQYEKSLLMGKTEYYVDHFGNYEDIDLYKGVQENNWQEQIYGRTGNVFSHDLSIRGGSDKIKYNFSYSSFKNKAIMIGSDYKRNNLSFKLNSNPNDKIDLSFSFRFSDTDVNGGGANEVNEKSSADSRLKHAVTYSPIPLQGVTTDDTDPEIASEVIDPIVSTWDNDRYKNNRNYNMSGSFAWEIIDNLKFRNSIGLDDYTKTSNRFYGLTTYYVRNDTDYPNQPAADFEKDESTRFRNAATLDYDFEKFLNADHSLKLLLGNELVITESQSNDVSMKGYPTYFSSDEAFKQTTLGKPFEVNQFYNQDDKLLSFFGRLNYDYKSKYILTATFRADGSSKFAKGNQWGYFPSGAFAWRLSEEPFMDWASTVLDDLKIRTSYGTAGNNNIPAGQTEMLYGANVTSKINNESFIVKTSNMVNPDLVWETTVTRNVGLDFSMFNSKLNGSVEAYLNTTTDLLMRFPVSGVGYNYQYRNMGETQNSGVELSINWSALNTPDYGLSFGFNIGMNKNKINSLGIMDNYETDSGFGSTFVGNDFAVWVDGSVGEMYGYRHAGMYTLDDFSGYDESGNEWILKEGVVKPGPLGEARPGLMKLKDLDDDGVITGADREIIGDANPLATGGFTMNGYVKGFDISAVFNFTVGNDIYNANKIEYTTSPDRYPYRNLTSDMAMGKRWTNVDPVSGELVTDVTTLASLNEGTTMWSPYMNQLIFSDWAVEDGSFLRLSTLTLGYTLPNTLTDRLRIANLRFYATAYNVFCLTNYTGFDPEVSTRRKTPLTPGVDYSAYPRSRQIVLGLNLSF